MRSELDATVLFARIGGFGLRVSRSQLAVVGN